ncbi:alanine--tRNA ligase [Thioalkalivibrio sp. XN279]|uniref:alanine--tRNA ligase n=1 Tax=Thioalkalivibrio sp. XN279 TaxID=2714953 RepID=UPI00140AD0EA|nr:alanine--tRNA ligase [Thioalkalivibrio sp. XN279]NHA16019.1 alanine--tRNA ligase [Thioalkalivibrio sp. XN279]
MKSAEIRQSFLDFFAQRGHEIVPSSPLVPGNDPTLLFTNAGMVQFKDVFLGHDKRPYKRACSSQRCVRAGGKHNDLENVGYTARHHTFFEMLGNFSFGDYFKEDAIRYAWDYVTGVLGIPAEKLWVTVFEDDDEAADIWLKQIGVSPERFSRLGADSNFWAMGDTGPCGPCSEIFYDHGPEVAGGPPGSPDEDGDRYVEIWNLVFMQFNRSADGAMAPLPRPSVDTGMGLERLAAVLQGVHSNYDIDLFQALLKRAAELAGVADTDNASLRVIADHIRACAFLIVDGVLPSNEGRGYVLRRIIRRAIRHGYQLGIEEPFFWRLVETLEEQMGDAYPELVKSRKHVEKVLHQEEERFAETLDQGMRLLDSAIAGLDGKVIPGETAFRLYDTYGFPVDLTADIARERGLSVDQAGFEQAMDAQRERARASSRFDADYGPKTDTGLESTFVGYDALAASGVVLGLFKEGVGQVDALGEGDEGVIVLDETPFYAESGGQVGDVGMIRAAAGEFEVRDTRKWGKAHAHHGVMRRGRVEGGESVRAEVDRATRQATVLNHSATHLLHAALRKVLGEHVQQKGSLVAPDRLRFDFSHYEPVSRAQLAEIEALVNAEIRANAKAEIKVLPYEDAVAGGALALFGEKYDDRVRVLRLGDFSMELCGGTHVRRAGDIGLFKVVAESGIASGVRRIEAVTGRGALDWIGRHEETLQQVATLLKGGWDEAGEKVRHLLERSRQLEKELKQLQTKLATGGGGEDPLAQAETVGNARIYIARLDGSDPKVLRDAVDRFKQKLGTGVVLLGAADGDKVRLVAGVTKDLAERISAVDLVNAAATLVGGKGGGRPDLAQAGGAEATRLDEALAQARGFARERLQ